ncbi:hypothetical protein TspCOW1_23310 [Thiohalobacter sp. COW1]|uniref:hypothetical protein n=1 Tax=Thiohalobacter sp. COW1 TaxID=2795687 RepID=UPI001914DE5B|nr:hypothetical protein [Thiohalobacter sp. COW1]BCO32228.1 hypothetical protein TspCOW1_23310 [Thiohalobacter sp. COW1]
MTRLDLSIPPLIHQPGPDDTVTAIQSWLDSLPKLNQAEFADALVTRLKRINQTVIEPGIRHALMSAFAAESAHLIERFCTQCGQVNFPLKPEKLALYDQAQALLEAMANGYKLLAMQLARAPDQLDAESRTILHESLLQATEQLSRRVLIAYAIYRNAPEGVWGEIHQLYRFAEGHDLATARVEHMSDWSLGIAYTQIVIAALCNPFHLFQNEIHEVYARLRKWAGAVRLRHAEEYDEPLETLTAERYFIDLDSDAPPRHGVAARPGEPAATRLLDIRELERITADQVMTLTQRKELSYREHQERDLLRRLRNAWSRRPTRVEQRAERCTQAMVVAGLTPAHYYLSGRSEFDPEAFEIHMHGDRMQGGSDLSLVPMEQESWRENEVRRKLEEGVIKPRSYGFDYTARDDDVWKRANVASNRSKTEIETALEQRISASAAQLATLDESDSGFGFTCPADAHININVGSLLAVQECKDTDRWCLAVIRWMRTDPDLSLKLGARLIPGTTRAVAVRGIEGHGAHTQYQRCIVLTTEDAARSYIVPAGLFHAGSLLLLNDGEQLRLLRFTRLTEMTKSYTRYLAEDVELNETRHEQVVQSLYRLLYSSEE